MKTEFDYFSPEMVEHRKRVLGDNSPAPQPEPPAPDLGFLDQMAKAVWDLFTALVSFYVESFKLAARSPRDSPIVVVMVAVTVGLVVVLFWSFQFALTIIEVILSYLK